MFRYITLIWDESDPTQAEVAAIGKKRLMSAQSDWRPALEQRGFHVLYSGARERSIGAHPLADDSGVVLGTLFKRHADSQRSVMDSDGLRKEETARIIASRGRELVNEYWGNYVAFLRNTETLTHWVLRGPASGLPCLRVVCKGVEIFFSCMADCAELRLQQFSINWTYVARYLFGPMRTDRTGLNEVNEITPGTCIEIGPYGSTSTTYWDPLKIAQDGAIESAAMAVTELRKTVRYCVHAWASRHESILHHLSGGLDSSIVLACLTNAPSEPRITCMTEHSPGADSDERMFARLAAQGAGCALIEERRDSGFKLERILDIPKLESPSGYIRRLETTQTERRVARQVSATAAFSGDGGDELFCRHHTQYYVADFVRRNGLRPALLTTLFGLALDSAVTEGRTIWTILGRATRDGLFPHDRNLIKELIHEDLQDKMLLRIEVALELSKDRSWGLMANRTTRECPPGRLWQVYLVTSRGDYYNPFGQQSDPEPISPLLSEPLIELCFQIPTYFQRIGRWDRAIARRAFAPDLPPEIAWRRSKGGMEEHAAEILMRNVAFIRTVLLDGLLVKEGIVDRRRLEAALDNGPAAVETGIAQIFHLLSAEAWVQAWAAKEQRAAA